MDLKSFHNSAAGELLMSQLWQLKKKKSEHDKEEKFDSSMTRIPKYNQAHQTRTYVAVNPLKFTTQSHGGLNLILNSDTGFKWIKEIRINKTE